MSVMHSRFGRILAEYDQVLGQLDEAIARTQTSHPPPLRLAYGNWPCAMPDGFKKRNASSKVYRLGRPFFEPAANGSWPIHNWPSAYFLTTELLRDSFRNTSRQRGWLWLDVERTHRTLPGIRSSPCGNQHPFGAISDAHSQILLGTLRACSTTCVPDGGLA